MTSPTCSGTRAKPSKGGSSTAPTRFNPEAPASAGPERADDHRDRIAVAQRPAIAAPADRRLRTGTHHVFVHLRQSGVRQNDADAVDTARAEVDADRELAAVPVDAGRRAHEGAGAAHEAA